MRHKIRRTALQLFDRYGFEKATVQMICRQCQIAVGTFYNYFESKEHLLRIQSAENDLWFENTIRQELTMTDPEAFIRAFFGYYSEMNVRIGPELYYRTYGLRDRDERLFRARPMYMILEDFLRAAQTNGQLRPDLHVSEILHYLFICVRGVVIDWCIHGGRYDLVQEVQNALTPLIRYYVPTMNPVQAKGEPEP